MPTSQDKFGSYTISVIMSTAESTVDNRSTDIDFSTSLTRGATLFSHAHFNTTQVMHAPN